MAPFEASLDYARKADQADALHHFKAQFHFPHHNGKEVIYFCGNSLGLQPKSAHAAIETELKTWREHAVGGYLYYQDYCKPALAKIMGASNEEITVMNALTVNMHLMMLSFYKPTPTRYKIMLEAGAFPSDQYAVETQAKHHGFNPDDAIIEIAPRAGEKTLRTEDILHEGQFQ